MCVCVWGGGGGGGFITHSTSKLLTQNKQGQPILVEVAHYLPDAEGKGLVLKSKADTVMVRWLSWTQSDNNNYAVSSFDKSFNSTFHSPLIFYKCVCRAI